MFTCSRYLVSLIAGSMLLTGCAEVRKLTYPPQFVYVDKERLQGSMHRMAAAMGRLDTLVAADSLGASAQTEILAQLDVIDEAAHELSGGKALTNHLLLDEHMAQFNADVAKARLMARSSPPNYYYAGRLSGSCSACHQFR